MKIETPVGPFNVHFFHAEAESTPKGGHWEDVWDWPMSTTCTLHPGDCPKDREPNTECMSPTRVIARSVCSWQDVFVKSVGRKISFQRAVSAFPKDVRTALWIGYFKRVTR